MKNEPLCLPLLMKRSIHRVVFSILRLHKRSSLLLSYGYVVTRKMARHSPTVAFDFIQEGMLHLVFSSMTSTKDTLLQVRI